MGLDRLRTGRQSVVDSKLFIAFIALIIFSELEKRKVAAAKVKGSILKHYSMQKLFDDFETVEEYSVGKGKPRLSEIPKKINFFLEELGFENLTLSDAFGLYDKK
jgi:hypothetical protein